jgi:NADPH:quinone reductase-like Zn-dependent oxidoreductase
VEQPTPVPGVGQVLVRVEAAGVGLADTFLREGNFRQPELPFVPGLEMAGTVDAVGEGGDASLIGKRVFAQVTEGVKAGCYAEYATADADWLIPLPDGVSASTAVALGVNALVAKCVVERGQVKSGERVLVRGAGGGIGVLLVEFAARTGATVVASTSSVERAERLLKLGADVVVDRSGKSVLASKGDEPTADWFEHGYDVILDPVAGPELPSFVATLRANGRLVLAGIAGGVPPMEFGMALFSPLSPTFSMLSLDSLDLADRVSGYREIFELADRGEIEAVIHAALPLEQGRESHEILASGNVFGKIVLEP